MDLGRIEISGNLTNQKITNIKITNCVYNIKTSFICNIKQWLSIVCILYSISTIIYTFLKGTERARNSK